MFRGLLDKGGSSESTTKDKIICANKLHWKLIRSSLEVNEGGYFGQSSLWFWNLEIKHVMNSELLEFHLDTNCKSEPVPLPKWIG